MTLTRKSSGFIFNFAFQMIQYKTKEEIEIMRHSCLLVGKAHAEAAKQLKPGMTTMKVNEIVEALSWIMAGFLPLRIITGINMLPAFQ
jgi:Mg2+ and Co2+ transporter CorA